MNDREIDQEIAAFTRSWAERAELKAALDELERQRTPAARVELSGSALI